MSEATKLDHGQITIAGGENAVPGLGVSSIALKSLASNVGDVYIGEAGFAGASDGYPISPGESIALDLQDSAQLKLRGTTGDKVAYIITKP